MKSVIMAAVGDVLVDRRKPGEVFEHVGSVLRSADLTFGNFEGVLTDTHAATPGSSTAAIVRTANAAPLGVFDIMSLANNHSMDAGYGGLTDTRKSLAAVDVATVGAADGLADALAPVIVDRGGLRIAVLAVTSVFAIGVEARADVPGIAPLRAEDCWAPAAPGMHTPGVPPRILSVLNEDDWERVADSVGAAREAADVVVASVHWGDHTRPWVLTDHERLCAELLAEAGADLVLGHHQHMLRGVEFVDGTPVCYGLGHLVFDYPRYPDELRSRGIDVDELTADQLTEQFGEFGIFPRPESPGFPFHPMARKTAIAVIELAPQKAVRCGMVPCHIDASGIPRPITRDDPGWDEAVAFLRTCAEKARLSSDVLDKGWRHAGCDVLEWAPARGQDNAPTASA